MKDNWIKKLKWKLMIRSLIYIAAYVGGWYIVYYLLTATLLQNVLEGILKALFGSYMYTAIDVGQSFFVLLLPVGLLFFVFRPVSRATADIQALAESVDTLLQKDDTLIVLPEDLKPIEVQLNTLKLATRTNERAVKEAEQRKNDLVVNLAHDIRTPLASVIGYLSLLEEAPDMPAEQRIKYTGITLEKACRLEQLVNEFFEITRFNLSTIVLSKGKIHLSLMLYQMADEFYPILSPENKRVVIQAAEDLVLWGDADKLARVFNNILKNAVAYSYKESIITITAFEQAGNTVIQFSNLGDPIPPQKLDTIFERFFRLDSARSSQTGGAGLGLAIAKEIVTAHGGTITAQSNNTSTTFTISLPIERMETGDTKQPT